jgi:hypothetical protein
MKMASWKIFVGVMPVTLAGSLQAAVLTTWSLSNKVNGALGTSYGLRLNQLSDVGVSGISNSNSMIFDFQHPDAGVSMRLQDNGGGLELHLSGNAYGALWDGVNNYSTEYAGTYQLNFVWLNVDSSVLGYDYLAENGIGTNQQGGGVGSVSGTSAGTAWRGGLDIYDWSGGYDWTLDVKGTNSPDASAWLTYGNGSHNGDFGFNMAREPNQPVPLPGTMALFCLGLLPLVRAIGRRRVREALPR